MQYKKNRTSLPAFTENADASRTAPAHISSSLLFSSTITLCPPSFPLLCSRFPFLVFLTPGDVHHYVRVYPPFMLR
jgi:hypothetical protein